MSIKKVQSKFYIHVGLSISSNYIILTCSLFKLLFVSFLSFFSQRSCFLPQFVTEVINLASFTCSFVLPICLVPRTYLFHILFIQDTSIENRKIFISVIFSCAFCRLVSGIGFTKPNSKASLTAVLYIFRLYFGRYSSITDYSRNSSPCCPAS